MTVWLLDTPDDEVLELSPQVREQDIVVRRRGEVYEVGRAHPGQEPEVSWLGEVERHLVPETERLEAHEGRTPLQRLDDADELEAAVRRLEEAEQLRGG